MFVCFQRFRLFVGAGQGWCLVGAQASGEGAVSGAVDGFSRGAVQGAVWCTEGVRQLLVCLFGDAVRVLIRVLL